MEVHIYGDSICRNRVELSIGFNSKNNITREDMLVILKIINIISTKSITDIIKPEDFIHGNTASIKIILKDNTDEFYYNIELLLDKITNEISISNETLKYFNSVILFRRDGHITLPMSNHTVRCDNIERLSLECVNYKMSDLVDTFVKHIDGILVLDPNYNDIVDSDITHSSKMLNNTCDNLIVVLTSYIKTHSDYNYMLSCIKCRIPTLHNIYLSNGGSKSTMLMFEFKDGRNINNISQISYLTYDIKEKLLLGFIDFLILNKKVLLALVKNIDGKYLIINNYGDDQC